MTTPVKELRGMVDGLADKLKEKGLTTNEKYLMATAGPKDRRELAKEMGVDDKVILELANRADLARIKGVSGVFSDLLEHAGVDTVKELATRNAANLHAKIIEVNSEQNLAGRAPTASDVENWVQQAKELPKILTY